MKKLLILLLIIPCLASGQYYYKSFSDTGTAPSPVFEPEYQAVLDYATTQGWALPGSIIQAKGNQLVIDLKANGVWSTRDIIYVFATDADSNFAKINWKNPGTYTATLSAMVDFISLQGYKGLDFTARITTGYQPSVHNGSFTLNNAQLSVWLYARGNSSTNYICGDFARNLIRQDGLLRITSASSTTAALPTSGFVSLGRSNSTDVHRNFNGTITDFAQNSSSVDDNPFTLLNRHAQNVGGDAVMSFFSAGGYVSGNEIYTPVSNYMSGL